MTRRGWRSCLALLISFTIVSASVVHTAETAAAITTWTDPVTLSDTSSMNSQVVASSDGTKLTAVWRNTSAYPSYSVQASSSTNSGQSWSSPTTVYTGTGTIYDVVIAGSADGGTIVAAWRMRSSGTYVTQVSTSTNSGVSWSNAVSVSATGADIQYVNVSTSSDGSKLTAAWTRNTIVEVSTSADYGASWSSVSSLSASGQSAIGAKVKISTDGSRLYATWSRYNGTTYIVQASTKSAAGSTWSTPINVSDGGCSADLPQLAVSSTGARATASWICPSGRFQSSSTSNSGGTWSSTNYVYSTTQQILELTMSASTDSSRLTSAWREYDGASYLIKASTSSNYGTTWTTPVALSATGQDAAVPDVETSADGSTATVAWQKGSGVGTTVQVTSSTNAGVSWDAPVDLGTSSNGPNVASSSNGSKTTVVWHTSNPTIAVQASTSGLVSPGLTPILGTPSSTAGGFTVPITNYDAAYSWSASTTSGSATVSGGVATVTGLSSGSSATLTVTTRRSGYRTASSTATGQSLSTQTVSWTPATTATLSQSPLIPSSLATSSAGAAISYAVASSGATGCTVHPTTAELTFTSEGSCTVRATAAAVGSYGAAYVDVVFTFSLLPQTVSWAPTTSITIPQSPLTPSSLASAQGGANISYSVASAGTTGCSVNSTSGVLTYTATGVCTVSATAAATSLYASASRNVAFTISKAAPSLAWAPVTSLVVNAGPTQFAPATSTSSGTITYSVTSQGATGCAVDSINRVLSFMAVGSCQVTATISATTGYDSGTSVVTFAISKALPTLSWAPDLTLEAAESPYTLAAASSNSDGAISYSVTSSTGAGCAFANALSPVMGASSSGTCTITATVAETGSFSARTLSVAITINLTTPTFNWVPSTSLSMPANSVSPSTPATNSPGAITYAVVSDTGTGCTVHPSTGVLAYSGTGQCQVTASLAPTAQFSAASVPRTFTVALASQTLVALASPSTIAPGGVSTLSTSGALGAGQVTWSLVSGVSSCQVIGAILTGLADGICTMSASIAADSNYAASSGLVDVTVISSRPSPTDSSSSSGSLSTSSASFMVPSTSGQPAAYPGTLPQLNAGLPRTGLSLPPAPLHVYVVRSPVGRSSEVRITLPEGSAGRQVKAAVVIVRGNKGQVLARASVVARPGDSTLTVTVPFCESGCRVLAYNVNELGVSRGAPHRSSLLHATTISRRNWSGVPSLFGTLIGSPVTFEAGSSKLDTRDKTILNAIANRAKLSGNRLFVTGFARRGGGTAAEQADISRQRAKSVASYLAARGVRVWTRYWGAGALLGHGGAADRRVEVRESREAIARSLVP